MDVINNGKFKNIQTICGCNNSVTCSQFHYVGTVNIYNNKSVPYGNNLESRYIDIAKRLQQVERTCNQII